jgi:hypothetical protein
MTKIFHIWKFLPQCGVLVLEGQEVRKSAQTKMSKRKVVVVALLLLHLVN